MRTRTKNIARGLVVFVALVSVIALVRAYLVQEKALNLCQSAFGKLLDHNGYFEVRVTKQHPTDETFEAMAFFYFPAYQNPPDSVRIDQSAAGRFASRPSPST